MSVLHIEPKVFEMLYVKLIDYTYRKEVNINYCSEFGRKSETELRELITTWANLNEMSYCDKYNDKFQELSKFIRFSFSGETVNTYQCLKWLQCIYYNIEVDTIKGEISTQSKLAVTSLIKGIEEIMSMIISEIPAYKDAQWSDLPKTTVKEIGLELTTRSQRKQLRLDNACRRYGKRVKSGANCAKYL